MSRLTGKSEDVCLAWLGFEHKSGSMVIPRRPRSYQRKLVSWFRWSTAIRVGRRVWTHRAAAEKGLSRSQVLHSVHPSSLGDQMGKQLKFCKLFSTLYSEQEWPSLGSPCSITGEF